MIECKIDGHVAVITLNNPSANTFTAEGLLELTALVGDLNRNLEVYAAVVTGQGDKFFSAGADLKTFADGDKAWARLVAQRFGAAFEAPRNTRRWPCRSLRSVSCRPAVEHRLCPGWSVKAGPSA